MKGINRMSQCIQTSRFATRRFLPILFLVVGLMSLPPQTFAAETVLVPQGASWKYLDDGSDQGTAWQVVGFNDGSWSAGNAQLGYGDGDEATVVSYGTSSANKFTTTYFRHIFTVTDPTAFVSLQLNLLRDDGAVVYLNGNEIRRDNMPGGQVTYATFASSALGGSDESTFFESSVAIENLVAGTNILAVEIHQANLTSSDISFDLELLAFDDASVIRGPYLQIGTPTSVIVRWRTDAATDSQVRYGTNPANLDQTVNDLAVVTEHEIELTGLTANTQYYYSVGTTTSVLAGENDSTYTFYTAPLVGTDQPTRVWILGDSGTANSNAAAVRDAYKIYATGEYTDVWLMLGDNAYNDGTDTEYQNAVFNMYPEILRQSVLWSTIGNHDARTTPAYLDIFTLPTQAEAGGVVSGTERYYSFDFANIHFICLDSMGDDLSSNGTMADWLRDDLMSTLQDWIIAFWHHPPYTKGSHNSDTESRLIDMRENFLPILELGGVDLVLSGHSHSYERSFLLDGHYGSSGTFVPSMKVDDGSGQIINEVTGEGAYSKPSGGPSAHQGAVYITAGSSGKISGGLLNHPAMYVSLNNLGSVILDIDGDRLDAQFLRENGTTVDYFTILKDAVDECSTGADCDDGLFCNGTETCVASVCQVGLPVNCDDGVGCTDDSCNEVTDSCDNVTNDANCDNGQFCDGSESCDALNDCQAGTAPNCDDGVGCTDDSCNEATDSCDHLVNDANCPDDDLFCTGSEFCDPVSDCTSTGDTCTGGTICNEATDTCDVLICDNNGSCESGEDCNNCPNDCIGGSSPGAVCGNGVCEAGDGEDCVSCPSDCNGKQDGKPSGRFCCGDGEGQNPLSCSDETCNMGDWSCTDVPVVGGAYCCGDGSCDSAEDTVNCMLDCSECTADANCEDGDACTTDSCSAGICSNIPMDCDDGDACTSDSCSGGNCVNNVVSCDDGDECTIDSCDSLLGCINTDPACQDNDGCCPSSCDSGNDNDCFCGVRNDPCNSDSDCCSNLCKGNGLCK